MPKSNHLKRSQHYATSHSKRSHSTEWLMQLKNHFKSLILSQKDVRFEKQISRRLSPLSNGFKSFFSVCERAYHPNFTYILSIHTTSHVIDQISRSTKSGCKLQSVFLFFQLLIKWNPINENNMQHERYWYIKHQSERDRDRERTLKGERFWCVFICCRPSTSHAAAVVIDPLDYHSTPKLTHSLSLSLSRLDRNNHLLY